MIKKTLMIINKLGLHARAAAKLTALSNCFSSDITLLAKHNTVDCKSVMALMLVAASKDTEVNFIIEGDDEITAMAAIEELISNRFDETE